MRRSQWIWGVALIIFGVSMLANEMGLKLPNGEPISSIFFPALLIVAGAWVLLGVFLRRDLEIEDASVDLQGATSATLRINHGGGNLKIQSGAGSHELAQGSFAGGLSQTSTYEGGRLNARMRPAKDFFDFPMFGSAASIDWDVKLNPNIPISLSLNLGANQSRIDLSGLNISDIDLDAGACDLKLTLPERGRFTADLDFGAASIDITLPEGLSARIRANLGAVDLNVDKSRFPYANGFYQSSDYETAANAVDLTLDGGAASVKVR